MPRHTKHQFLAAAGHCFRRYGYFQSRMEGIAAQVPCSKVTLYKLFPDKTALAEAWLVRSMTDSRQRTNTILANEVAFNAKVAAVVRQKQVDLGEIGAPFFRDMMAPTCPESLRRCFDRQAELNKQQSHRLFKSGRSSGAIHPEVSDDLIWLLLDHFQRLFTDPEFRRLVPESRHIDALVGLFLHGLALAPACPGGES